MLGRAQKIPNFELSEHGKNRTLQTSFFFLQISNPTNSPNFELCSKKFGPTLTLEFPNLQFLPQTRTSNLKNRPNFEPTYLVRLYTK